MADKLPKRAFPTDSKLAKAETLLALALLTDLAINPWLFSQPAIPPAGKTLIKMALVIGLFGPVQNLILKAIDGTLKATRTVTSSMFSAPRMAIHACIFASLFVCFYWTMNHAYPWSGLQEHPFFTAKAQRH